MIAKYKHIIMNEGMFMNALIWVLCEVQGLDWNHI